MTIGTGNVALTDVMAEFQGPNYLTAYYRGAGYTTTNNTGVPTSGPLSLLAFRGAQRYIPGSVYITSINTWSSWATVTATTIYCTVIGGGGNGGVGIWGSDQYGRPGGGGSGGYYRSYAIAVAYGSQIQMYAGGAGGTSYVNHSSSGILLSATGGGSAYNDGYAGFAIMGGAAGSPNGATGPGYYYTPGWYNAQWWRGAIYGEPGAACACASDGTIVGGAGGSGSTWNAAYYMDDNYYPPTLATYATNGGYYGGGGGGGFNSQYGVGQQGAVHVWW